jgi:hypothetical protein
MANNESRFPEDEPDYKKLEKLVAKGQQASHRKSKVSHNVRLGRVLIKAPHPGAM